MKGLVPLVLTTVAACGTAGHPLAGEVAGVGGEVLIDQDDAWNDVRLAHPDAPGIDRGTFDLEHLRLARDGEGWRLEATFRSPVRTLPEARAARDRVVEMLPQTIDVYLDLDPAKGQLAALPGRGFRVAAQEAWDRVLVVSSVPDLAERGVVYPSRVFAQGKKLVALFPGDAIPEAAVRGALAVVLATSTRQEGRVRRVAHGGDCRVWDDERCTLEGGDADGPPVLDALASDVYRDRPIALTYLRGERPTPEGVPVVFVRGTLVTAAPVPAGEVSKGRLATVIDGAGRSLATAVVLTVVGDTASLELVGEVGNMDGAQRVVFAAPGAE